MVTRYKFFVNPISYCRLNAFFLQRVLESSIGKFTSEIAVLKEQNTSLETRLQELKDDIFRRETDAHSRIISAESRLDEHKQAAKAILAATEQRAAALVLDLEAANAPRSERDDQFDRMKQELEQLRRRLEERPDVPSCVHASEIDQLKEVIRELEQSKLMLVKREDSIAERYKAGDLVLPTCRHISERLTHPRRARRKGL